MWSRCVSCSIHAWYSDSINNNFKSLYYHSRISGLSWSGDTAYHLRIEWRTFEWRYRSDCAYASHWHLTSTEYTSVILKAIRLICTWYATHQLVLTRCNTCMKSLGFHTKCYTSRKTLKWNHAAHFPLYKRLAVHAGINKVWSVTQLQERESFLKNEKTNKTNIAERNQYSLLEKPQWDYKEDQLCLETFG